MSCLLTTSLTQFPWLHTLIPTSSVKVSRHLLKAEGFTIQFIISDLTFPPLYIQVLQLKVTINTQNAILELYPILIHQTSRPLSCTYVCTYIHTIHMSYYSYFLFKDFPSLQAKHFKYINQARHNKRQTKIFHSGVMLI